ncbi:MAG: hypothetical protein HYZ28_21130 [Myxococcales bacterium]|nr:hypothetical protein [Myxococcales bacterium]
MAPSNMWQQTEELAKKHDQGGGQWVKLAGDGDKAVVVFLGEPYPREVCFVDGKYMPFDEKLKAQGLKPSLRVALNVALYDTKEVKVLEQGVVFFKDLVQIRAKYGLDKWAFEVQRHGAAKDPKTTYSLLPEHQLTPEQQKEFQALPQHDLEKLYGDSAGGGGSEGGALGSYDKKGGDTVEPKTAQSIAVVLKALPKDAVDRFCKKFGVARIKDLPAAQVEKAVAYLDTLEGEFKATKSGGDVDPFS